jgi:DNA mismatch repair protein MutL
LNIIGTMCSYILLERSPSQQENEIGLCLLDQNLARARILYEQFLRGFKKEDIGKQLLFIPLTFEFSKEEATFLDFKAATLESLGFSARLFGEKTIIIDAIPSFLKEGEVKDILESIINEPGSLEDEIAGRLALSITKNLQSNRSRLNLEEAKALVDELLKCGQPYFSPTGKPITAWVPLDHLERFFK